jgi:hypothetical protein
MLTKQEAVRREDVPDYYDVIKDPMDLTKIRDKLNNGSRNPPPPLRVRV